MNKTWATLSPLDVWQGARFIAFYHIFIFKADIANGIRTQVSSRDATLTRLSVRSNES